MNRRKRTLVITLLLSLLLLTPPFWITYREYRQARLDHALIEAIKAGDDTKALEVLAEGASGEARDTGAPLTLREVLLHVWNHFRHAGQKEEKHVSALFLLYYMAETVGWQYNKSGPDPRLVQSLLDHGARVNDRDDGGNVALIFACIFSNRDTVRLLLSRGADINATGLIGAPLNTADDAEVTRILLEHGANLETKNQLGQTPLFEANAEKTRLLLAHGANIEARDISQDTPLICAVERSSIEAIQVLLDHRANIEAQNIHKETALMIAAKLSDIAVVRLLLEHGAKVSALDDTGGDAIGNARDNMRRPRNNADRDAPKIIALLKQYGAK